MKKILSSILMLLFLGSLSGAESPAAAPFSWKHQLNGKILRIEAEIAKDSYLYQDKTKISVTDSAGNSAKKIKEPGTVTEKDVFEEVHQVYPEGTSTWEYSTEGLSGEISAVIEFQGCRRNPFLCYPPDKIRLPIGGSEKQVQFQPPSGTPERKTGTTWKELAGHFKVTGSEAGYMDVKSFGAFLDDSTRQGTSIKRSLFDDLKEKNILISFLLILIGGLALNMTPCVLPMIPVNIAIIGAGANAASKLNGFILGLMYGAGITLVYGILGLAAVLTGSTFGSINSSPYFNFAAGLVFIALALSMFDIIPIDFSRFMKPGDTNRKRSLLTAMFMGGISALLAGACVAPVVIAVLLFSSYLYSQGDFYGLLLPFLLGAGMALPWPFAGAGLTLLPKPGAWMLKVKYAFGIFIAAIAAYYLFTGYSMIRGAPAPSGPTGNWNLSLQDSLSQAEKEGKPLLIDFTASWCKNCEAMDLTTLKDPKVVEMLGAFVKLKFHAENPNDPATKEVLSHFMVLGLPTYVVLKTSTSN